MKKAKNKFELLDKVEYHFYNPEKENETKTIYLSLSGDDVDSKKPRIVSTGSTGAYIPPKNDMIESVIVAIKKVEINGIDTEEGFDKYNTLNYEYQLLGYYDRWISECNLIPSK